MNKSDMNSSSRAPGRNDLCPCGSGKKYKKCCGLNVQKRISSFNSERVNDAISAFESGSYVLARQICSELLESAPDIPDAQHVYALSCYQLRDMEAAAVAFKKAISLMPNNSWVNSNYALFLKDTGHLGDAERYGRLAVELDKKNPDAYNNLGTILRSKGSLQEAIKAFKSSLNLQPSATSVLVNLGEVYLKLDKLTEAENIFHKVLELETENDAARNNLGVVYQRKQELDKALQIYKDLLARTPGDVEVLNNIGLVYRDLQDRLSAEKYFQEAIRLDPVYVQPYKNLADLYVDRRNLDAAIKLCKQSISINKTSPVGYQKLASIYKEQDRPQLAKEAIDHAMQLAPSDYELYITRASIFENFGKVEEARADYMEAAELARNSPLVLLKWAQFEERVNNLAEARRILEEISSPEAVLEPEIHLLKSVIFRRQGDLDSAIKQLENLRYSDEEQSKLATAIFREKANIFDKQKKYTEALKYYILAAKSREASQGIKFSPDEYCTSVESEIGLLNRSFLKRISGLGVKHESDKPVPIFIVGFPRSGTTLLEQILCSHPKIVAGDELPFINEIVDKAPGELNSTKPYPGFLTDLVQHSNSEEIVLEWRRYYQSRAEELGLRETGVSYYTDKMPLNLHYLPLISIIFPESPIIHIMRNPMDSVLSSVFSNFAFGMSWANDLSYAANYYKDTMRQANHVIENMSLNYLLLTYEDLVSEQEEWTRKIIEFVGLEWDERCLDFHKTKRVAKTASYEQVTKKIYSSSVARYRNYEEHLAEPLEILKPVMEKYGYL